jgi:hypothetical protein
VISEGPMRKTSGIVQKLDIGAPGALFGRLSGTLHRIQQTREKASRERVETTTELADETPHDRS